MLKRCLCCLGLAAALFPGAARGAETAIEATVLPMAAAEERLFDPWKPPGAEADAGKPGDLPGPPLDEDGKPLIVPKESACTVYHFRAQQTSFQFEGDARTRITITSASVTLAGTTVIHLPVNAGRPLVEHERGHDLLARYAYGRIAQLEVNKALRGFLGKSYLSRPDKTAKQVAEDVFYRRLTRAAGTIQARIDALSDEFDRLTQRGRSRSVDTKTGIEQAKEWFEKGPPDARPPQAPVPRKAR